MDQLVVEDGGRGYAHDLPIDVQIEKPPAPISAVATAKATALLSDPKEGLIRSWLPSTTVSGCLGSSCIAPAPLPASITDSLLLPAMLLDR